MKLSNVKLGIDIDMQAYYDDLILLNKSIEAQIKALASDPSICTHNDTKLINGITVCANKHCHKAISTNGLYDWCV